MTTPYLRVLSPKAGGLDGYHALFAAEVPFLPNFFAGETFAGTTRSERMAEIIQRQVQFISALAHLPSGRTALDLRFVYRPSDRELGTLRVGFVGRGSGPSEDAARQQAHEVWQTLQWVFPPEYPLEPAMEGNGDAGKRFDGLYAPFEPRHLAEIRKGERYLKEHPLKYLACPFYPRPDSMVQICRALMQNNHNCLISICLIPITLKDEEIQILEQTLEAIRHPTLSLTEQAMKGLIEEMQEVIGDLAPETLRLYAPEALSDMLSAAGVRLYERLLRAPHLLAVKIQIASDEPIPEGIVHALGADLSTPPAEDRENLQLSGYNVVSPEDTTQRQFALWDLEYLALTSPRWNPAPPPQEAPFEIIQHLVTPEETSAAFRLPVVQDNAWIGISTRIISPFYPTPVYSSLLREKKKGSVEAMRPGVAGPRLELELGIIIEEPNRRDQSQPYPIPIRDLVKHALIVGVTGSGKTTTCLHLLTQLGSHRVPFLVIEPAKCEYRALIRQKPEGADELLVFTVGDDETGKLRFDPFRVPIGVNVATHISLLTSCFAAAFPMGGPLEILLTRAFREAYRDLYGPDDGRILRCGDCPPSTPSHFLSYIAKKAERYIRNYEGELRGNLTAALQNRLEWLQDGIIGRTINPNPGERYIEIDELLQKPAIIELRRLADNNEKALLMAFLLTMMAEYYEYTLPELGCDAPVRGVEGLRHVTLIEEAHRLLANIPLTLNPEVANSKGKAIELFIEMLGELRSRGEGIFIAEQIPTKLVSDAIKNTNLKIMHRITPEDDRLVLGATMNLDERQRRFITILLPGQAAVFREEFEAAVLVQVPDCRRQWAEVWRQELRTEKGVELDEMQALREVSDMSDREIQTHMQRLAEEGYFGSVMPQSLVSEKAGEVGPLFLGWNQEACQYCWDSCVYRNQIPLSRDSKRKWDDLLPSMIKGERWEELKNVSEKFLSSLGLSKVESGHVYCYLAFLASVTESNLRSPKMQAALQHFGRIEHAGGS